MSPRLMFAALALAGCSTSDPATDPPAGDLPDAGAPDAPDTDPGPGPGPGPDPSCRWQDTAIASSLWTKTSNLALAISATGDRAVVFTAAIAGHRDLYAARSIPGGFAVTPYGFDLLPSTADAVAAGWAPDRTLKVAFANEAATDFRPGGVDYTQGPGGRTRVDDGGLVGFVDRPALAFTALGAPRIAYQVSNLTDRRVVVATSVNGVFQKADALIDSHLTGQVDFALDAAGRGRVVAIEEPGTGLGRVLFAAEGATSWAAPLTVTADGGAATGSSLVVRDDGTVHMARLAPGRVIKLAGAPPTWQKQDVSEASLTIPPTRTALAVRLDETGRIHAVFGDLSGRVWYIAGGQGEATLVANPGQRVSELAIGFGPGGAYVAYAAGATPAGSPVQIHLAHCD